MLVEIRQGFMNKEKFRYTVIYDDLKKSIMDGTYGENSLLPTEQSLSLHYDVNRSTLRKAMQLLADEGLIEKKPGKGTIVLSRQPETREPSGVVSNKNIGFLLPRGNLITEPFYSTLFSLLEQKFQPKGCSLIYTTLDDEDDMAAKIAPLGLSGIVFVSNVSQKHIHLAVENKFPCALVNSCFSELPSILSDNKQGAYLAGRYLIENGHRRVAVLAGVRSYISNQERMIGIKRAFFEAGCPLLPELILETDSWLYETAEPLFTKFIAAHRDALPTAVFAFNDRLATGAVNAIRKAGLSVPEDISVIGYDNLGYFNSVSPKMATVETHIDMIAEATVSQIMWQLHGGRCMGIRILSPVEVVEGETVLRLQNTDR